jgi:hypothetical protein
MKLRAPDRIWRTIRAGILEPRSTTSSNGVSMADSSMTGAFQLNLPKDLLSESKRVPKVKSEQLHVEGWRSSWMSRLSEIFVGKD